MVSESTELTYSETTRKIESQIESDKITKEQAGRLFRLYVGSAGILIALLSLGSRIIGITSIDLSISIIEIGIENIERVHFNESQLEFFHIIILLTGSVLCAKILFSYIRGIQEASEAMQPNDLRSSIDYKNVKSSAKNRISTSQIVLEHIKIIELNEDILNETNKAWENSHNYLQELIYSFSFVLIYSSVFIRTNEESLIFGAVICIAFLAREFVRQIGQDVIKDLAVIHIKQDLTLILIISIFSFISYLFIEFIDNSLLVLISVLLLIGSMIALAYISSKDETKYLFEYAIRNGFFASFGLFFGGFLMIGGSETKIYHLFLMGLFFAGAYSFVLNFSVFITKGLGKATEEEEDLRGILAIVISLTIGSIGAFAFTGIQKNLILYCGISLFIYGTFVVLKYRKRVINRLRKVGEFVKESLDPYIISGLD